MTSDDAIPYRPLGQITQILEELGFQVTHCYEDLIFVAHNAFLVQMGEKGEELKIWFNEESEEDMRDELITMIKSRADVFQVDGCGLYKMVPNEEEQTFQLEFIAQ